MDPTSTIYLYSTLDPGHWRTTTSLVRATQMLRRGRRVIEITTTLDAVAATELAEPYDLSLRGGGGPRPPTSSNPSA